MELALEIDCQQVQQLCDADTELLLLDCREPEEFAVAAIAGACLLPMNEIEDRRQELAGNENKPVIVFCHHGLRSAQVAYWLRQQGFGQAQSMAGGIDRWSQEVDPSLPRY